MIGTPKFREVAPLWPVIGSITPLRREEFDAEYTHGLSVGSQPATPRVGQAIEEMIDLTNQWFEKVGLGFKTCCCVPGGCSEVRRLSTWSQLLLEPNMGNCWHTDGDWGRVFATLWGPGTEYWSRGIYQVKPGEILCIFGDAAGRRGLPMLTHRPPIVKDTPRITVDVSIQPI